MKPSSKIAKQLFDQEQQIGKLGRTSQVAYSTVGGEAAIPVATTVAEAAVTNEALPVVQDDAADGNTGVSDLQDNLSATDEDLDARFEQASADLEDKAAELVDAQEQIRDAFGQQISDLSEKVDEIVVGAGGVLLLYSDEAPTSEDKAPAGSTWWMVNAAKNIVGQWQQTGTDDEPVWTPRPIESDVIANLDVGKLSAGQAAIAQLVAMKIAASTASIQTVNVGNLFVTDGATMNQATINYLFANVVAAKKITADMLDVNSLNGVTLTGTLIKTAASGQRLEMLGTRLDLYGPGSTAAASILGFAGVGASQTTTLALNVPAFGTNQAAGLSVFNPIATPNAWSSWSPNFSRSVDITGGGLLAPAARLTTLFAGGTVGGGNAGPIMIDASDGGKVKAYVAEVHATKQGGVPKRVIDTDNGVAVTADVVKSSDYQRTDGSSLASADYLQVTPTAAVPVSGTTDVTIRFVTATAGGRLTTSAWSATGDGFTVPAGMGGLWQLSLSIRSVAGGQAFFQLNGTYVAFQDGTNATLNAPMVLAAGDKVRLFMFSSSASNSAQAATRFTAIRLGS